MPRHGHASQLVARRSDREDDDPCPLDPHVLQNLAVSPITETYPEAFRPSSPDLVSVLIESHVRNLGCVKNSGECFPLIP